MSRRSMLRALAGGVAASAFGSLALPGFAFAANSDDPVQQMLQNSFGEASDGFDAGPTSAASVRTTEPILSPSTAGSVEQAIAQYSDIVARGGWPEVPAGQKLSLGMQDPTVVILRQRLQVTGDLAPGIPSSSTYDSYVDAAVRRFQARHGLPADGILGDTTVAMMNIPANVRLGQLQTNLVRLKAMSGSLGDRYVMVNVPAAAIEVVDGGRVVSRHTAVVGKIDRETPILNSKIYRVSFNPNWTVPASIIRKDLIPLMQKEPGYLTKKHIRIYDSSGMEVPPTAIDWTTDQATKGYMFRQDPGDFNSLGTVRISFHNDEQVYMHDTPLKDIFGNVERFDSSGCVRVQNVRQVIAWLLRDNPDFPRSRIDEIFKTGEQVDVNLKPEVPVYLEYITAWATPDGAVYFRNDIYNRDGVGQIALQ
ncbi:Putative peptidoglycan binding domain-containing protein [Kaistia soli DSM 19436]|uniref:Putative peptidoglycan binding domain-containing protein n=2 Tax=Kaistia TaxID=166953 RepID=A0A1M5K6R7_9HYPH|nr:L,D-transpeptidase family protein [Kaistia soli]SHG48179.1 Putative peptidoglycan binding domain-containing protein [Kaistia soli DSM 19436]